MAIDIKFDLAGNPEPPTIILANRNGNKLGQLKVNEDSIELSDKFNDASEFSFTINKYINNEITYLWDKVVDFKLVYCKEWDCWFEIKVELDEATETVKTVFCTQLGQAELSQIMLYNIEINTEKDIERDNYILPTVLYRENGEVNEGITKEEADKLEKLGITLPYEDFKEASLLHRLLKDKAPHYSIKNVDQTIKRVQKSFSFDGSSIYDSLQEVAEEIGCLFVFHSNSGEDGKIKREISVYDLWQNCNDCGHRGEFTDKCPECDSENIKYGYGEDTLIFVTADELASNGIQLVTDIDSVKNCFKLEAGDDLMTATIRNCNPNGSDYIWYFSDSMKEDMSEELVDKIEKYDKLYSYYYTNANEIPEGLDSSDMEGKPPKPFKLDEKLVNDYNALVEKYKDYYNSISTCLSCDYKAVFEGNCPNCGKNNILSGKNLQSIPATIMGYADLINAYYDTIDLALYLKSSLMPNVKMGKTNAWEQGYLLETSLPSLIAVTNLKTVSLSTANSYVLAMAKAIVSSSYKVEISSSELADNNWSGNFIITNYSDDEDTYTTNIISRELTDYNEDFIRQKIEKTLSKENTDDLSITGLFEKEYDEFCEELKKYALNPLIRFHDACQICIDILIEQGVGSEFSWSDTEDGSDGNLYEQLYKPYYDKLTAIEAEMKIREDEINIISGDGDSTPKGLQLCIEECRNDIQDALNFEKYLGEDLWLEFCSYRREDKYSNDNYISDGLDNARLFERALEFFEVAENEIYKSSELQHSISTTLNNLLAIPKFKDLVKSFKVGNWIRVRVDDRIFKLRLLEYDIDFGDFNNIPVEFSDVTKIKNGITDVENVFSQASSMATSYSSVKRQANQGGEANGTIEQWSSSGLNTSVVQINTVDNGIVITKNGLLGCSYDDATGEESKEQLKLTHNTMSYTDDSWKTVRQVIGKHDYVEYDKAEEKFVDKTGYGMSADFVTAGVVNGSQIIGGDIYSKNYSDAEDNKKGSYINLEDGTFNFGGESLSFDGTTLRITSPDVLSSESVTEITSNYLKTTNIYAENLKVKSANIDGKITASQINTTGLIAENISGDTITGKTISGGSINIGNGNFVVNSSGIMTAKSGTFAGTLSAVDGTFAGTLSAVDGTFTSLSAGKSSFKNNQIIIDASYIDGNGAEVSKGSIYIGRSGISGWEDITIRPSSNNLGNIGTPNTSWDMLYVKNGAIQSSDKNYKTDVSKMGEKQEQLFNLLSPVTFKFIDSTHDRFHYGFISQEVEDAIIKSGLTTKDFAGFCKDIKRDEYGEPILDECGNQTYVYSLRYNEFIALNTHMIQQLQLENCKLKERIDSLESALKQLS